MLNIRFSFVDFDVRVLMLEMTIIHSKIMTQITLDISDTYVSFFMKLIKNFDFI